jgi:hypothetical protein
MSFDQNGDTQAFYRELNERIAEVGLGLFADEQEPREFLCECGHVECQERFTISFTRYRAVRENAHRFLVVPGHDDSAAESVVLRDGSYWVVETLAQGDAAVLDGREARSR